MKSKIPRHLAVLLLALLFGTETWAVRVKDIASLRGARNNQLTGFGIVVGLDGTGDSPESLLSRKPIINALERMGISLNHKDIAGRSVAAVWLTATLPPFAKSGQHLDVTAATIGDATSLRGGVLVMAPLRGPNRLVYAVVQGPIVGIPKGLTRDQGAEDVAKKQTGESMVASVGQIPGGGLVEREINLNLNSRARLFMNLNNPDFTTSFRLAKLINQKLGYNSSRAKDAGTVEISVPDSYLGNTVELISYIENLEITPDNVAQVVLDERTGTIVMGGNVRISPIAISHGNMSIQIKLPALPSQATPPAGGAAGAVEETNTIQSNVFLFKGGADLKEVVDGFNKIGASSKDLIQVLKAVKSAGALHAELLVR
ncbi:flagellar basal body P-ring protein FlgI [Deltaproteobacteria bacterium TL4]